PLGGTLVARPALSGGPRGADRRWPGTLPPVTQPRVGNVVRRRSDRTLLRGPREDVWCRGRRRRKPWRGRRLPASRTQALARKWVPGAALNKERGRPLRRSCEPRLHVGKRRGSSLLVGTGAPRAEP
ncbi:hypothetical protein MC885_017120, partial [Smutsia gigantea]